MRTATFDKITPQINHLTDAQAQHIEHLLQAKNSVEAIIKTLEKRLVDRPECSYCHHTSIKRNGKTKNGMQRYLCGSCKRSFVATTNTPLHGMRFKEKWLPYLHCMLESRVLRVCSDKCGISITTAFRWRHCFLKMLCEQASEKLNGVIEIGEDSFRYSEKGKRKPQNTEEDDVKADKPKPPVTVVTLVSCCKQSEEVILIDNIEETDEKLRAYIAAYSVLYADQPKPYLKEATTKPQKELSKLFQQNGVKNHQSHRSKWMERFFGVATKYLPHYLNWFSYLSYGSSQEDDAHSLLRQLVGVTAT